MPDFDPTKFTGIRAIGESDRSLEYKGVRDAFVEQVNGFLKTMQEVRDGGGKLRIPKGIVLPLTDNPRITHTNLGINPMGLRSVVVSHEGGLSLTGDGEFSPLEFQAVIPDVDGNVMVVEISGTNPMLPKNEAGEFTRYSRSDGDFAKISLKRTAPSEDGVEDVTEVYSVLGDGSVHSPVQRANIDLKLDYDDSAVQGMQTGTTVLSEMAVTFVQVEG